MVSAAVGDIQGGLGVSADEASWLTTLFLAGQLLAVPLAPILFAVFGLRRMILALSAILFVTSLLGGALVDPGMAALARFGQGASAGCFGTGAFAILFRTFGGADLKPGLLSLAVATTWPGALGIVVAGPLVDAFGWPAMYAGVAALALVVFAAAWAIFDREAFKGEPLVSSDWTGYLLFAPGAALLAVAVGQGERHYWSAAEWVGLFLVLGLASLTIFALIDRTNPKAIFRVEVCGLHSVAIGLVVLFVYRFALQESATLTPRFLTTAHGLRNADMLGLLGWGAVLNLGGFLASLPLVRVFDPRTVLASSLACMALGTWALTGVSADASVPELLVPQLLASAGGGCAMLPLMVLMLADLKRPELGASMGIAFNGVVAFGTTAGQAWTTWLLRMREYYHSNVLVDAVPATRDLVAERLEALATFYGLRLGDDGVTGAQAAQMVAQEIRGQAFALAFSDSFLALASLSIVAIFLSLLFVAPPRSSP